MVRIRKNLKVSPLQFLPNVAPEDLQPHICKLNQSPWDSSPCPSDLLILLDSSSSPLLLLQFEAGELGFAGNGSLGDSIAAVESVASPMDIDNKAEMAGGGNVSDNVDKVFVRCQKNDGRSWQCKKEAIEGFVFCDHHLRKSYSYINNVASNGNNLPSKKDKAAATAPPAKILAGMHRARPKAVKKGASSANPYEFYYYSGFGPKWSRKRSKKSEQDENEEEDEEGEEPNNTNNNGAAAEKVATSSAGTSSANTDPQPSNSHRNVANGEKLDYMEDDFDEEEDGSDEEGGPRRVRRPVKARSLMSIINVKAQES